MKRINFTRKIGLRLTVVYVTTLFISCLTIGVVVYSSLTDVVKRKEADSMDRRVAEFKFAFLNGGAEELVQHVEFHKKQYPDEKFDLKLEGPVGEIYRSEGRFKNFSLSSASPGYHIELMEKPSENDSPIRRIDFALRKFVLDKGWVELLKFFNFEVVYVSTSQITPEVRITIIQSFSRDEKDFNRARMLALVLVLVFIGIGIIIGKTLSRSVLLPIRKFMKTIDRIEAGDISARVDKSGTGDEFDLLAGEFNGLMDSKDALIKGINETLDTVAHEIRTPLTRFRIGAEVAISDRSPQDKYESLLREGLEASEQISYLLTNILESSRATNGSIQLECTDFLVNDIFTELKDIYTFLLEDKAIKLEISLLDQISIHGDRRLLLQAVNNLLDNAIKHTPRGGTVTLRANESPDFIEVIVTDTGIGIPVEEHQKIWQRLYRSRNHNAERGYGIGLSVVKSIVELHKGTVRVESEIGKGSTFFIRLF